MNSAKIWPTYYLCTNTRQLVHEISQAT